MNRCIGPLTAIVVLLAGACGSDTCVSGNEAIRDDAASLAQGIVIETAEAFADLVVGTVPVRSSDGVRDAGSRLAFDADGTLPGFAPEGEMALDWDGGFFCRSGVSGLPGNPVEVALDCQLVVVDGDTIVFIAGRGADGIASRWFIE